jgi:hypothetical protein
VIYRWLGFWAVRRAYRLLVADDPRPLAARLTHEAKRVLILAGVVLVATALIVIAAVAVLVTLAT